ncbi:hypothetical protein BDN70DRAFT_884192, partial [Pholiota conissans]
MILSLPLVLPTSFAVGVTHSHGSISKLVTGSSPPSPIHCSFPTLLSPSGRSCPAHLVCCQLSNNQSELLDSQTFSLP